MCENERLQPHDEKREMIINTFTGDTGTYLRNAAISVALHHTMMHSFLKQELKLQTYRLQML